MLIYFTSALAEAEQTPFDLLEAESELIAGFHIEYSGMKFAMFFLAQFLNSFFLGAIMVVLFLGGWQGPFVDQLPILGVVYFFGKTFLSICSYAVDQGDFPPCTHRPDDGLCLEGAGAAGAGADPVADGRAEAARTDVDSICAGLCRQSGGDRGRGQHFVAPLPAREIRTKREFEPKSLIGTMRPAPQSGD